VAPIFIYIGVAGEYVANLSSLCRRGMRYAGAHMYICRMVGLGEKSVINLTPMCRIGWGRQFLYEDGQSF
jgi:hypothetical protein